ncbi:AMP-binding protein [Aliibacillus thermotolerans]|mgnify:FL=1|nr:AMP-binding protein [Aliibacillus thermotolerans]
MKGGKLLMSSKNTLPALLIKQARDNKDGVALRQKKYGIWNEITWGEYFDNVHSLSLGLKSEFDFKKGEKLAIIGDNRPDWLYAQLATQSLGGISVGIYQESFGDQLVYYLNHCDARIVIAEDQEQVDKLLEIENQIPKVEKIIYYNDKGLRRYTNEKLVYIEEIKEAGKKLYQENERFFIEQTEQLLSSDVAIISYTAGVTDNPKGVMLTHENLIQSIHSINEVDPINEKEDYLSFLPLAWIGEQLIAVVASLYRGITINFPEQPNTVLTDFREIGPHLLLAPPRTYENIISRFYLRMNGSSQFKRKIYRFFRKFGRKYASAQLNKGSVTFFEKFMYWIGDYIIFSAIRDHLGLARIKNAYIFGAPLSLEAIIFFHSIGVNVKQTYGTTEAGGIVAVHRNDDKLLGSVGLNVPNVQLKLSQNNEVYVKSPSTFIGYYKNNGQDMGIDNGWLATGDFGNIDDNGHLHIIEDKKSMIRLASGEHVPPSQVENSLKNSNFIKEAIIYGQDKTYLVALININYDSVGTWAKENKLVYTTPEDLPLKEEVIKLIEKEVTKVMEELPEGLRIKKFVILQKELSADDGELTRTRKIRRRHLEKKYKLIFESMYIEEAQIREKTTSANGDREMNLRIIDLYNQRELI